jgi:hypothetical protein
MDQQRVGRRARRQVLRDRRMQRLKLLDAAMDVADGVDALAWRQGGGGGHELDHAPTVARSGASGEARQAERGGARCGR